MFRGFGVPTRRGLLIGSKLPVARAWPPNAINSQMRSSQCSTTTNRVTFASQIGLPTSWLRESDQILMAYDFDMIRSCRLFDSRASALIVLQVLALEL